MASDWQSRLNTVVNIGVIIVAGLLIGGGPIKRNIDDFRRNSSQRRVLEETWPELTTGARAYGNDSARAVIVEFGDYQCPACKSAHKTLDGVSTSLGISIAYRHYPLSDIHPQAEAAARASICAEAQGAFRGMHAYLYEHNEWAEEPQWPIIATRSGVPDTISFKECLMSQSTSDRLARDMVLANKVGVKVTPTFVGPSRIHPGARPDLLELIRR